jgi:hypothetical protein
VLRVHFAREPGQVIDSLAPVARHLAAAGLIGFAIREGCRFSCDLAGLGASRVCRVGEMQSPPISWSHDGQGVLIPLARFADLEISRGD